MIDTSLEKAILTLSDMDKETITSLLPSSSSGEFKDSLNWAISFLTRKQMQMEKGDMLTDYQEAIWKLKVRQRELDEQQFRELLDAVLRTEVSVKSAADTLEAEIQERKDHVTMVNRKLEGHKKTMSVSLEHQVAVAVKEHLRDATILAVGYKWQRKFEGSINESDAIVVGVDTDEYGQ